MSVKPTPTKPMPGNLRSPPAAAGSVGPPPAAAGPVGPPLDLAALQATFQNAMLNGDDAVLGLIPAGAHESREVMLGVYRNAYLSRLMEFVANDYELLCAYLGDEAFEELSRAYATANVSHTRNARYYAIHLPRFLAETEPYRDHPQVFELALIEKTLADAFDAPDAAPLTLAALSAFPIDEWPRLVFTPHPSARRLVLKSNAFDIWKALKSEAEPPDARSLATPAHALVWRQDVPKARMLGPEEAMMWNEAGKGVRFGILCEMVATFDEPEAAPARAAGYLAGWIGGGLLSAASLG